jgi:hypothetical protein
MQVEHKPEHSVENDVESFIGWKKLLEFAGKAETKHEKNLIAFTFETGGRITEVLRLRTVMFEVKKALNPHTNRSKACRCLIVTKKLKS